MERVQSSPESAAVVAALATQLAGERDLAALVRRAMDLLRRDLGAEWSCALGVGESSLGGLRLHHACSDPEARLAALGLPTEEPPEDFLVARAGAVAGLGLWLPQHTRLMLACGPVPGPTAPLWLDILNGAGRFLLSRLHDGLELQRALLANSALERRIDDLSLLFKGLDVTLSSVELTKVLRAFLTCVTSGEAIGFNRAFLLLLDEEQKELRGTVAVGPSSGEEAVAIWNSIEKERTTLEEILRRAIEDPAIEPRPGSLADRIRQFSLPLDPAGSILARAATSSGPYNIHVYDGEQPEPFADAFDARQFVVIPIQGRERTLGVIVVDNLYTGKPIEKDNVFLLSGLANHVGVVIENALMFEDVSRRYAELNQLQTINRALLSSTDYGDVLHQIAQISALMLGARGTLLFMVEGQPPEPRLERQHSVGGPPLPEAAVRRCTEIARETLARGTAMLVRDVTRESYRAETGVVASLMSVPMKIDVESVGVLVVYRAADADPERTVRFDLHSQRFLSIIADQAAIALLSGRRLSTIREDQRQIQQLNELLYRNEKLAALGQVSSKIAHEIRNPLTALGGFARRMLHSANLEQADREAVEIIVRETARLERILNDQLAFVRSARLQLAPTSLNQIVREGQVLLRQQLEAHHVGLKLELTRDLPRAQLDGDRIKQVLVNLLMNAIEACEPGGSIFVATRSVDDTVELEVANTGPPIAPELAATLFMPFASTKQEGTGLGLAVVQQIVVEHSGSIMAQSRKPWGSVFTIRLPLAPPAGQPAEGAAD